MYVPDKYIAVYSITHANYTKNRLISGDLLDNHVFCGNILMVGTHMAVR